METNNNTPRYLDKGDTRLCNASSAAYFAIREYYNEISAVVHGHLPVDEYNAHHEDIEEMLSDIDNILRKMARYYYMSNPLAYICATSL